jgi:mono/diheme cytochrome c family protein
MIRPANLLQKQRIHAQTMLCACLIGLSARWSPALTQRRGGDPAAAQIENPVAATAASIAAGKRTFAQSCESCHGPSGKGDGTAAGADQPSDLSDDVWDFGASDGEIFTVIRGGVSGKDMRPFAGRLTDEQIWNVVNFVRTLAPR